MDINSELAKVRALETADLVEEAERLFGKGFNCDKESMQVFVARKRLKPKVCAVTGWMTAAQRRKLRAQGII